MRAPDEALPDVGEEEVAADLEVSVVEGEEERNISFAKVVSFKGAAAEEEEEEAWLFCLDPSVRLMTNIFTAGGVGCCALAEGVGAMISGIWLSALPPTMRTLLAALAV